MSVQVQHITVKDLVYECSGRLQINWVTGKKGSRRRILPELASDGSHNEVEDGMELTDEIASAHHVPTGRSFIGYLNLIHPHQIQIIGNTELGYIESLRSTTRADTLRQLIDHSPACVLVANDREAPSFLEQACAEANVPLLRSPLDGSLLIETIYFYLSNLFAEDLVLHGVFLEVMAIGVLITGPSGIGKSELALELITRGHRLIADDAPQFSRISPDIISGSCPPTLRDYLEVRGMGVINVRRLYGDGAVKQSKYLRLIVRLEPMSKENLLKLDRLSGSQKKRQILGVEVPEITLPVAPGRNLAILLECAARNQGLISKGYNASEEFIAAQQAAIDQNNG